MIATLETHLPTRRAAARVPLTLKRRDARAQRHTIRVFVMPVSREEAAPVKNQLPVQFTETSFIPRIQTARL
ncbi:MAG: hypothetical protein ACK45B_01610 [Limisphaerales bacterium]